MLLAGGIGWYGAGGMKPHVTQTVVGESDGAGASPGSDGGGGLPREGLAVAGADTSGRGSLGSAGGIAGRPAGSEIS